MNIALITGSSGLIGGEAVKFFSDKFDLIIGIDNDYRAYFFGQNASTKWNEKRLTEEVHNLKVHNIDIRDFDGLKVIFNQYGSDIKLVVHTAAQPSHDWAAKEPLTDFSVNATGTLNMLELTQQFSPRSCFYFYFNQQSVW